MTSSPSICSVCLPPPRRDAYGPSEVWQCRPGGRRGREEGGGEVRAGPRAVEEEEKQKGDEREGEGEERKEPPWLS